MAVDPITQFELNRLRANNFTRKSFKLKAAVTQPAPRTIRILYGRYNTPEAKVFDATIQSGTMVRSAQVGATIQGANNPFTGGATYAVDDKMGYSVSLSKDGNIAAISSPGAYDTAAPGNLGGNSPVTSGNVKLYEYNGTSWSQKGSTLYVYTGTAPAQDDTLVGTSVDLSDDGLKLLVQYAGFNSDDEGYSTTGALYYVYESGDWVAKGGPAQLFRYGYRSQMSNDGNVIVITNPAEVDPSPSPRASIWEYDSTGNSWSKREDILLGSKGGGGLDINNDGSIICTTASYGYNTQKVKVFKWNGTSYDLMGAQLEPPANVKCRMNDAGDIVVVSGTSGLRVFRWNGTSWVQDSTTLGTSGTSIAFEINPTGDIVVTGTWEVFQYYNGDWTSTGSIDTGGQYPTTNNDGGYPSFGGQFTIGLSEI